MIPTLQSYLLLGSGIFCLGLFAALSRRNAVGLLIGIELMANGVNLNLVAFSRFTGLIDYQVFALFSIALTVAEVVVGLALVILIFRHHRGIDTDLVSEFKG